MNLLRNSLLVVLLSTNLTSLAQIPEDVPHPDNNTPIDLSKPFDLIVFVILPIVIIILYVLWRQKKKNK
ncbi:hypothetical protein ULVI_11195 [Cochleicola gelatinilyticus]|uniref:Adenylosuccinate synthetase n=2 Tax=Cochleicola gelatinilyticus TaxID=1763537 RepID=A0A167GYT6_9FLAO|nr:hypothetical protein ULVI_11195 [Cochleicola gelatinilyticus]